METLMKVSGALFALFLIMYSVTTFIKGDEADPRDEIAKGTIYLLISMFMIYAVYLSKA